MLVSIQILYFDKISGPLLQVELDRNDLAYLAVNGSIKVTQYMPAFVWCLSIPNKQPEYNIPVDGWSWDLTYEQYGLLLRQGIIYREFQDGLVLPYQTEVITIKGWVESKAYDEYMAKRRKGMKPTTRNRESIEIEDR